MGSGVNKSKLSSANAITSNMGDFDWVAKLSRPPFPLQ